MIVVKILPDGGINTQVMILQIWPLKIYAGSNVSQPIKFGTNIITP